MRKKIVVVKQHDFTDCGPACLLSIICYYGGYVPLELLRFDCETDMHGTSVFNLIKAAKKYGFSSKAIRVNNINDFNDGKNNPFIAHVKLKNNLNHFLVIYEIKKSHLIVMDPHLGKIKMTYQEFYNIFTNIIIFFHPLRKISNYSKPKNILFLINQIIKNNKKTTLSLFFNGLLVILLSLVSSYYIKTCGLFTSNESLNSFIFCSFIFFAVYLIKNIINYIKNNHLIYLIKCVNQDLYFWFIHQIYNLPLSFIKSRTSGEIISRFNELYEINNSLASFIVLLSLDLIMIIVAFIFASLISLKLTLMCTLFLIFYMVISLIYKNPTLKKVNNNIDKSTMFTSEVINDIKAILSFKFLNNDKNVEMRTKKVCFNFLSDNYELDRFFNKAELVKDLIYDFILFFASFYGLYLNYINNMSLTNLFTFIMIIGYLLDPIKEIFNLIPKICFIKASLHKLHDFSLINDLDKGIYSFENGAILIKNLSFAYNGIDNVISNFSLSILVNEKVLIKGESGSGKSTLCQILSGQYEYCDGLIKIGKHDLRDIKYSELRKNITYIGQSDSLLIDTIINNIKCERKVSDKKLATICKICEIEKIIGKKYDRFNTNIDESSTNISGGEKQRIILARGLINCGKIIILDEALSEVNLDMEERIIKNIFKYFKDKTILYVSHKNYNNLFNKTIYI